MVLRKLAAVGAAAAGLVLVAGPALADAPYTVTVNGSTSNTASILGTNKAPVVLTDNGLPLTCTTSTITLNVTGGVYPTDPATIATIAPATFTDCDFEGFSATVTANTDPAWPVSITGGGNTTGTDDVIAGKVSDIDVNVSVAGPLGTCSFEVTGSVGGQFDEDNGKGGQELEVTSSDLTIGNVDSALTCVDLVGNGDRPTFMGSYNSDNQAVQIS